MITFNEWLLVINLVIMVLDDGARQQKCSHLHVVI